MRTPLLLLATSLLLCACSSTPKPTHSYLLRSSNNMETRQLSTSETLSLGSLKVAEYIDQPGLVTEQADGTIHTARYNKWAEPLRLSLREFLCAEISVKVGYDVVDSRGKSSSDRKVDVVISQLHGDSEGNAVLSAEWTLKEGEKLKAFRFAETLPLEGSGYDALIDAQKKLLVALAGAVAQEAK